MTSDSLIPRSISVQTLYVFKDGQDIKDVDWQKDGSLSFEAFDGSDAWYGQLSRQEYRNRWPKDGLQNDLSKFDELIQLLRTIPKNQIYPEFPADELTIFKPQQGGIDKAVYFKAPRLNHYRDDGNNDIAMRLLNEARVNEIILHNPHPNLGSYLGCVEEEGRLVRIAFKRYDKSLYDIVRVGVLEEFSIQQRRQWINGVEEGAKHLHKSGLAHNDISPSNIMIDDIGRAILIDHDSCAPLGSPLTKGGLVTGWKGPLAGEGRHFKESSVECDNLAIQEIRKWLKENGAYVEISGKD
jgi:serine/threonine protein kinase